MAEAVPVTIYHNPSCGTSRNTLALIRNAGVEPAIIEYLKTPPDRATLESLIRRMGIRPRELLRQKGTPYEELGLGADQWTDAQLIDEMLAHPILINRPIVVTPWGVRLCRPSEVVLDILHLPQKGPYAKEDGEQVIDAKGHAHAEFPKSSVAFANGFAVKISPRVGIEDFVASNRTNYRLRRTK